MSLARDLELAGDIAAAEDLLRRVRETSRQLRGERHSRTLFCAANLGRLLRARGKEEEADEIIAQTYRSLQKSSVTGTRSWSWREEGKFIEMEMEMPDR